MLKNLDNQESYKLRGKGERQGKTPKSEADPDCKSMVYFDDQMIRDRPPGGINSLAGRLGTSNFALFSSCFVGHRFWRSVVVV